VRIAVATGEALVTPGASASEREPIVVGHVVCVLDELDGASAHTEVHVLPDELRAKIIGKRDRYESILRTLIQAGIASGVFIATDAKMATLALLGALNGATRWYRPEGSVPGA